jgi:hypothetical protein
MLCIIDEFSRESPAIRVARKLKATDVIEALYELFVSRASLRTYVPTTAPSSSPRRSEIGPPPSESEPLTSNLEVCERIAIAKASTAGSAINCSMARSATY